jgi:hypothetical protein
MQQLLSRAVCDAAAVMRVVRLFAVAGLDQAGRGVGRRGLAVGSHPRPPIDLSLRAGYHLEASVQAFLSLVRRR